MPLENSKPSVSRGFGWIRLVAGTQRDWDMASLAHVGHAAERHLLGLFIDHPGISPLHYLRLIRLERARQSLEKGASVTRAAVVAGIGSDVQLHRAWSRQWGESRRDAARAAGPDAPAPRTTRISSRAVIGPP